MLIHFDAIVGLDQAALVDFQGFLMHEAVVDDWVKLQSKASDAGFDLVMASAYRSFERQLMIWNEKADGTRAVYDADGQLLDPRHFDEMTWMYKILYWSALPGCSRHHWGCDFDVYDRSVVPENYRVQLSDAEVYREGIFAPLHHWLDTSLSPDFFRPFDGSNSVAPERWHLSHRNVSQEYERILNKEALKAFLAECHSLKLKDNIMHCFDDIYDQYISLGQE